MALLNGLGRLVHGSISDKIGRKNTVILCFAEYLVAFLLLLPNSDTFIKWLVGICIVGFSYGGYLADHALDHGRLLRHEVAGRELRLPVHGVGGRGRRAGRS